METGPTIGLITIIGMVVLLFAMLFFAGIADSNPNCTPAPRECIEESVMLGTWGCQCAHQLTGEAFTFKEVLP